ncbi:MAG TPA: methyltransferase domain-containing protein [Methylomirabilota bacterium]|nr:methyltransferase domain-containing protein [Methylomirabilota bacterium]
MSALPYDPEAFRRFEKAAHDRVSAQYHDFFAPVTSRVIEPLLDAARVGKGTRLLDVATGPGVVVARAAARGVKSAVGVDLSPKMVALAARLHPGLDFREGDAEALPFPDGAFDAVVANFGLGHFPRPQHALGDLARVIASGGMLALSWWDLPSRARVNGIFSDATAENGITSSPNVPAGPPPFRFAADDEFAALLRAAGLTDVVVTTVSFTHRIPDLDFWWNGGLGSLARSSANIHGQPPDVQRKIRATFDRLAKQYAVPGGFDVPVSAKICSGVRS